jgi:hypothetical protein
MSSTDFFVHAGLFQVIAVYNYTYECRYIKVRNRYICRLKALIYESFWQTKVYGQMYIKTTYKCVCLKFCLRLSGTKRP